METLQRIEELNILFSHMALWIMILTICVIAYELSREDNADD